MTHVLLIVTISDKFWLWFWRLKIPNRLWRTQSACSMSFRTASFYREYFSISFAGLMYFLGKNGVLKIIISTSRYKIIWTSPPSLTVYPSFCCNFNLPDKMSASREELFRFVMSLFFPGHLQNQLQIEKSLWHHASHTTSSIFASFLLRLCRFLQLDITSHVTSRCQYNQHIHGILSVLFLHNFLYVVFT